MKNDALNRFKEEMNRRGLIRKIQVCANLIPPPPDADPESLIQLHRNAAKMAIANYAANHDDFYEVMFDAALDHLLDGVLTDDLFAPDKEFAPTKEEVEELMTLCKWHRLSYIGNVGWVVTGPHKHSIFT